MAKVYIIGGCGHIGMSFAAVMSKFHEIKIYDTNQDAVEYFKKYNCSIFYEPDLDELLHQTNNISISESLEEIHDQDYIIITIGTPIDEYLSPKLTEIFSLFKQIIPKLNGQTIILRSTVYPGTTKKLERIIGGSNVELAFCPERVAGGSMIHELQMLPQIISANTQLAIDSACELFKPLNVKLKILYNTTSGELAKLMTNAYRYIHFAIGNEFFCIAQEAECDFYELYDAMVDDYPRMKTLPKPGFTSGYCVRKDTVQLAAWKHRTSFNLGYDATFINEGMPLFIFREMKKRFSDLENFTIGILGLSFKPNIDDTRDSLSFRMRKILKNEVKRFICHDPLIKIDESVPLGILLDESDIIVLMTPHDQYKNIDFKGKFVVDIWNFYGKGVWL